MNKKTFSISEAISFGWHTFKSNWKFWIISFFIFTVASGSMSSMNFGNLIKSSFSEKLKFSRLENNYDTDINTRLNKIPNSSNDENMLKKPARVLGISDVEKDLQNTPSPADYRVPTGMLPVWMWFLAPFFLILVLAGIPALIMMILVSVVFRMGYLNLILDAVRKKDLYYKTLLSQVSLRKALRLIMAGLRVFLIVAPFILLSVGPLYSVLLLQAFFGGTTNLITWLTVIFFLLLFSIPGIILALKYSMVPFVLVDLDKTPSESMKISRQLTKNVKFKLLWFGFACSLVMMLGLLVFGVGVIVSSIVVSLAGAYVYNKLLEQSGVQVEQKSTEIPVPPVTSGSLLAENRSLQDSLTFTE